MRILYIILMVIFTLSSCVVADEQVNIGNGVGDSGVKVDTSITPSCVVESRSVSRAESAGVAVRSLIDQITTKRMDSNFLRLDEDLNSTNDGLYTFTGNNEATPYATNWNRRYYSKQP